MNKLLTGVACAAGLILGSGAACAVPAADAGSRADAAPWDKDCACD